MKNTLDVQVVEGMANTAKSVTKATCSNSITTRFRVCLAVFTSQIVFGVEALTLVSNMQSCD